MANRTWNHARTLGIEHVYLPVTFIGAGTGAPTLGEGDPNGTLFTITRNSAGNFTLKTKDPYLAVVDKRAVVRAGYKANMGTAVQGTDKTWSFPIYTTQDILSVASVGSITAGTGYANSFPVTFTGGGGTGALGVATASGGAIQSVTMTDGGFGYTSAPTPVFTAGGGSTGSATAVLGTNAAADLPAAVAGITGSAIGVHVMLIFRNSSVTP